MDDPPPFEVVELADNGRRVIAAHGELDIATVPALQERLAPLIEAGRHVVLDLSELSFIDARGITVLISAKATAARNGARFEVRDPSAPVRRVLRLCGVDQSLDITPAS